jgi:acyl dehydratase
MSFDLDKLTNFRRELSQTYTTRDTILYALGVGAGIDVDSSEKLKYVYEEQLEALPTMSVVLAAPGFWQRESQFGIAWQKILHAEQSVLMHKPLPVAGSVVASLTVDAIYDKGASKGALLYTSRKLYDGTGGDLLATIRQGTFLRGDGGAGGLNESAPKPHVVPEDRPADVSITLPTRSEQALLYRLSGDFNPLHVDAAIAAKAGFSGPLLHGLATYGVVARALLRALCEPGGKRLGRMDVRFVSPVYPGDSIMTDIWLEAEGRAAFRSRVPARDVVVLDHGYAEYQ